MFCSKCGKTTKEVASDWNESAFPYMKICPSNHKCYLREKIVCPEGMKFVRTTDKEGYQTVPVPKEWNHCTDKNYHAVNLAVAFFGNDKK